MPPTIKTLLLAVKEGDMLSLEHCLSNLELTIQDAPSVKEAFFYAVREGHVAVVNRLFQYPPIVDDTELAKNVFYLAALVGNMAMVNCLLQFEVVVQNIAFNDNRVFLGALSRRDIALVNRLLEFDAVVENVAILNNQALRWAVSHNDLDMVDCLLKFDAVALNVIASNVLNTALMRDYKAIYLRLLQLDPVVENIAMNANAILDSAILYDRYDAIDQLLQYDAVVAYIRDIDQRVLTNAIVREDVNLANCFFKNQTLLNKCITEGILTLQYAAKHGDEAMIHRLLQQASVLSKLKGNCPEVLSAAMAGRSAIVNCMLEHPSIRACNLGRYDNPFIKQGLERALWLSLQNTPGFSAIRSFSELSQFAHKFVVLHPLWVHPACPGLQRHLLVKSMLEQMSVYTVNLGELLAVYPRPIAEIMDAYRGPLDGKISLFSEPKFGPARDLAFTLPAGGQYLNNPLRDTKELGHYIIAWSTHCVWPFMRKLTKLALELIATSLQVKFIRMAFVSLNSVLPMNITGLTILLACKIAYDSLQRVFAKLPQDKVAGQTALDNPPIDAEIVPRNAYDKGKGLMALSYAVAQSAYSLSRTSIAPNAFRVADPLCSIAAYVATHYLAVSAYRDCPSQIADSLPNEIKLKTLFAFASKVKTSCQSKLGNASSHSNGRSENTAVTPSSISLRA